MFFFLKFIHLIFVITLIGCLFGNLALTLSLARTPSKEKALTVNYTRTLDILITILIGIQFVIGSLLAKLSGLTFHTPWVSATYLLLTLATLCQLGTIVLKKPLYTTTTNFKRKIYLLLNAIIFICLYLIVHDAITKTTYLSFLHSGV